VGSLNLSSPELFYRNKSLLRCPHAYDGFLGLHEDPFSLAPDPRYLYRTRHAHETLRQLTRGILARKGLILLSGEVGTGKTTLLNGALQALGNNPSTGPGAGNKTPGTGNKARTAVLMHPTLTREEFIEAVLTGFQVPFMATRKPRRLQILSDMLLDVRHHGGIAVLAIDEAQLLSPDLLDEIRMFASMRAGNDKLLQIILCGQPEIEGKFRSSAFWAIQPLVTVRCVTSPLSLLDTSEYIHHRMKLAGAKSDSTFTSEAAIAAHHLSQGIPRLVNLLCSHALAAAGALGASHITARMIGDAAERIQFPDGRPPGPRPRTRPPGNGTFASTAVARSAAPVLSARKPRPQAPASAAVPRSMAADTGIVLTPRRAAADWPEQVLLIWLRLAIRRTSYRLECWSANFGRKRYSLPLLNLALSGAMLLALAQSSRFSAGSEHTMRSVLGFSGLLLLDISLGLAGYLFLNDRWKRNGRPPAANFLWSSYKRIYELLRNAAAS
jgi:general secretion pathway protein A